MEVEVEVEGVSCGVPKVELNPAVVLSPSRPTTGLVAPSPINTQRMLNATYRDALLFSWKLLPVLACSNIANEIVNPYRAGAGHKGCTAGGPQGAKQPLGVTTYDTLYYH